MMNPTFLLLPLLVEQFVNFAPLQRVKNSAEQHKQKSGDHRGPTVKHRIADVFGAEGAIITQLTIGRVWGAIRLQTHRPRPLHGSAVPLQSSTAICIFLQ
ncbi:hypothetical protein T09_1742 [Trichinella sp. T9]|nr:hypothetical protein T09_1742 [Trichinella sp. T9]